MSGQCFIGYCDIYREYKNERLARNWLMCNGTRIVGEFLQ